MEPLIKELMLVDHYNCFWMMNLMEEMLLSEDAPMSLVDE
jgi:hypothetical protein